MATAQDPAETGTGGDAFAQGIGLFNEEYFFEAHDHLEDLWHADHGASRLFLQGLIQVCAGFHHVQNGNLSGAADLLQRGTDKLRSYPQRYMGLDAATLIARVDEARTRIERMREGLEAAGPLEYPKIELGPEG